MKIVIREWLSNKKAFGLNVIRTLLGTLITVGDMLFVKVVTETITEGLTKERMMTLVILASIIVSSSLARNYLLAAKDLFYTRMADNFSNKVINADYDMYTDISCSAIVTASSKLGNISQAGKIAFRILERALDMVVTLIIIWRFSPVIAITAIPIYVVVTIISKKLTVIWGKLDNRKDVVARSRNHELDAVINGFCEVRAYQTEHAHANSIRSKNKECYELCKQRRIISVIISAVYWLSNYAIMFVSIVICAIAVTKGQMSVAVALSLYVYIGNIINPLSEIIDLVDDLAAQISVLDDYDKIMSYQNKLHDGNIDVNVFEEGIELKDVSFKYKDSEMVLQNVNMTIPKGAHIGICGTSGCGKSSLFKLLEKFYKPCGGAITIDGIPIDEVTTKSLRQHISIVSQDPYIFDGTILDNLTYGNKEVSTDKVKDICKTVGLDKFITELPNGLDTKVGPRGIKLSGGQCQRISFARALIRESEILLLDEATSALDNVSEQLIQDTLNSYKGLTIVTIAHRLTTIKDCDCIYVFHGHTVDSKGTHEELMETSEVYRNLVNRKTE